MMYRIESNLTLIHSIHDLIKTKLMFNNNTPKTKSQIKKISKREQKVP